MMKRKDETKFFLVIGIIGILTYLALCGLAVPKLHINIPSVKSIRTGIDIRGGVRAVLSAPAGTQPTQKQIDTAVAIINKRLQDKGVFDKEVTPEKTTGRIIVQMPWKSDETNFDPQQALEELGKTALLTFQEVDSTKIDSNTGEYLPTGKIIVQGNEVVDATAQMDQSTGKMSVSLELSPEAQKKFEEATGRLIGSPIGIFMDNSLVDAPIVNGKIPAGTNPQITFGSLSADQSSTQANELASTIRAGALPFKLETIQVESISPLLGENALHVSIVSGIVALILVWLFMLIFYRLPGIIADIALLGHTVLQLLLITWAGITITLPGIAGIILTIGMGVDANIIIFERIKEELKKGKPLKSAIDIGFKKAFTAILDANMTTLISAVVLYIFGSGPIQSFAITLGLGVALSFLTAVTATRIMLKSVSDVNIAKHHWLYGV